MFFNQLTFILKKQIEKFFNNKDLQYKLIDVENLNELS